ncbi:type I polyketide synthase [Streptomyces sp. TP-A0874]|uniref:type I polyketide synthase n=1 Tax=Streptomyces sp. TP-A0874 TaxID=549819 RepID=UPI000853CFF2|nr:type I polyketide synthase [Streptomyces sp. TP-A0874]
MTDLTALIEKLSPQARAALARQLADAGVTVPGDRRGREPIALIGIGCRYPGGVASPDDFWRLLSEARDAVGPFPAERWGGPVNGLTGEHPPAAPESRNPIRSGGFIEDADRFDAAFFGISPSEAVGMDPQQRVLLEVAWEALEHAGQAPRELGGSRTGVYVGIAAPDYIVERLHDPATRDDLHTVTGAIHSTAVGRLSYLLDLRGPSVAVDTACSSSLVAVHLACQSLRDGESDLALAGGVHVISSVLTSFGLRTAGLADEDGRCKTFDASASGIVRAEGCGVVALKRLSDAERAGDRILAVIRGSAVNQDGRSTSLTAPSVAAQREVLTEALSRSGVAAEDVGLVETHGTGTVLGDPIEVEALSAVYGGGKRGACALGAVKTNFGHAEEAAGVAGLIKAALCVRAGVVPPNLHLTTLNPDISLAGTRLVVPRRTMEWPVEAPTRYAAVSAFGMGGTNAHLVLSGPPVVAEAPPEGPRPKAFALPLTAGSPAALRGTALRTAEWLDGPGAEADPADIAHTLGRRSSLEERLVLVADAHTPPVTLAESLRAHAAGETVPGVAVGGVLPAARRGTVWVFPGQGGQWAGMGRELLAEDADFAAAVEEIDPLVRQEAGFSVRQLLAEGADPDVDIARAQPLIFTVQVALARVWQAHGLRPAAVLGHSMGEVAAAVVAGALSLPDAVRVICRRSRLAATSPRGQGAMALVELSAEAAAERLAGCDDVSVAVLSGPQSTVVSGAAERIDQLVAEWSREGLLARRIRGVTFASHSPRMDSLLPELREELGQLCPLEPQVTFYSTAADDPRAEVVFDADYWVTNLRNPVRFADAVAAALVDGHRLFVEISPHPTSEPQISAVAEAAAVSDAVVVPSLRRDEPERRTFLTNLGSLYCHGVPVALPGAGGGRLLDMPTTAWDRRRYWLRPEGARGPAVSRDAHPLLGVHIELPGEPGHHLWQARVGADVLPWLAEHRVGDVPVLPGTAYCEMALAAAASAFRAAPQAILLEDIDYQALLSLDEPVTLTVTLRTTGPRQAVVEIVSAADGAEGRTVHATARTGLLTPDEESAGATALRDVPGLLAAHGDHRAADKLYRRMRESGQYHGPAFRGTTELRLDRGPESGQSAGGELSVVSRLGRPAEALPHPMLHTHPALLDGWLHLIAAAVLDRSETYLPAGLRRLRFHGDPDDAAFAHARLRPAGQGTDLLADVELLSESGLVVAEAGGIFLREVAGTELPVTTRGRLLEVVWEEAALPSGQASGRGQGVVVLGTGEHAQAVRTALAEAGRRCTTVVVDDEQALAEAARTAGDVLLPLEVDQAVAGGSDEAAWLVDTQAKVLAAARAAVALATAPAGEGGARARLWIITRGARALSAAETPDLTQAGIRGLARTLALEHPDLRTTLVDLDPEGDGLADLAAELAAGGDDEVAWRGGRRHIARLRRGGDPESDGSRPAVRAGSGYIVTGGLTGVGLRTADWLAARGAGCLVLNARSAPDAEAEEAISRMRAAGTEVRVVRGDIAAPETADRLVKEVAEAGYPLRGVVHSAMVLDDCVVANLDAERLDRVWRPKALGAWWLHRATADTELDWWVCYSSIASLFGGAGQANYAAANAFVDTLAEWRAARGLPALSLNWGGWAEIGRARELTHEAFPKMPPAEGLAVFGALAGRRSGTAAVLRLDTEALARTMPETLSSSFFAPLVEERRDPADDDWIGADALRALPRERLRETVAARLPVRVARILGYRSTQLSTTTALTRMGLDSLMAVKTKNAVLADFGVALPVARLLQGLSLTELEDLIVRELAGEGTGQPGGPDAVAQAQQRARARRASQTKRRRNK